MSSHLLHDLPPIELPEIILKLSVSDDPFSDSSKAAFAVASRSSGDSQPGYEHPDYNQDSSHLNLIGAILGGIFRILKFLRSEPHGEVFAVEDVVPSITIYEAKAYTLKKLPPATYKYRVRNIKRLSTRSSFEGTFDHEGRKFIVNSFGRNTRKWDEAFPPLAKAKASISTSIFAGSKWKGTTTASLISKAQGERLELDSTMLQTMLAPVHLLLQEGEAQSRIPQGASDFIAALLQATSTTSRSRGPPAKSDEEPVAQSAMLPNLGTAMQVAQEKLKKVKTPHRKERNRIKQWEKRIEKRAQKVSAARSVNAADDAA